MSNTVMFKSQLLEYTQKASLPKPLYEYTKDGPPHDSRFKATVVVNGVRYDSASNFRNRKAAEHAAAQLALEELQKKTGEKKLVSNQVQETGLCKNMLLVYAQKNKLPEPVYKITRSGEVHQPLFMSTVEIGGFTYTGDLARSRKEAETKAAHKAWMAIQTHPCYSVSPFATPTISGSQVPNPNIFRFEAPKIPGSQHETGLCKNLLQEYVQKNGLSLPVYRYKRSGEMHNSLFIATVEVDGISYTGGIANSKKDAEAKAARKALLALQQQA